MGQPCEFQVSGVFARATLARHPNANAELDLFPDEYITAKSAQVRKPSWPRSWANFSFL